MTGDHSDALSAPVVAALEHAWAAIRSRHPDLPEVVVVLASGSVGTAPGTLRLGHFAAMRWNHADNHTSAEPTRGTGESLPEVFVGGEGLARGPVDVLGTLLHEATHALAFVRGIKDTSRQGRYHNRRFATLAAELGLHIIEAPGIGWSDTHVPDVAVTAYAGVVDQLRRALTIYRCSETPFTETGPGGNGDGKSGGDTIRSPDPGGPASGSNNPLACACPCGRRIRAARTTLTQGPILCGLCNDEFEPPHAGRAAQLATA